MASTLKPFRQYNEHEVLNLFSLVPVEAQDPSGDACVNMKADGGKHTWDAGRLLINDEKEMKNTGDWDPVTLNNDTSGTIYQDAIKSYLGANYNAGSTYKSASGASHVGLFGNSNATLTATPDSLIADSKSAIGIALRSTLAYDENNEKLMYYTNKQDELQAVLPGDAVPCLRRGLIAMVVEGVDDPSWAGNRIYALASSGQDGGLVSVVVTNDVIGEVVTVMDRANKICLVSIDV